MKNMNKEAIIFKNRIKRFDVLAYASMLLVILVVGYPRETSAAPAVKDVIVVNDPLNVAVVNEPVAVTVLNEPVAVTLDEPVDVNVVNNDPPVGAPTEPFQISLQGTFVAGSQSLTELTGFPGSNLFTVPSGKRLVIEHVSVLNSLPGGQGAEITLKVTIDVGEATLFHRFVMTKQLEFTNIPPQDRFTASQAIKLYPGPGTDVVVAGQRDETTGEGTALLMISGFLVPVP